MKRLLIAIIALLAVALLAWGLWPQPENQASSYAGLGETAEDFAQARPGTTLNFPQDHAPHPDYRIEWWYLTANLVAADGRHFGVQWTLFRQAMAAEEDTDNGDIPWQSRQLWMAHAALSTPEDHRFSERFARGGIGQAGVTITPFRAWIDDWYLRAPKNGNGFDDLVVKADGDGFAYRLHLDAQGPLVRHGQAGFSQKSADGQGSMYYSQPFFRVDGRITVDGEPIEVTGRAWLDREWSSQLLGPTQSGWDWFSLHLDGGAKLMAFRLRGGGEEGKESYLSGSWISPDGEVTPLVGDDLELIPLDDSQVAGRRLPTRWRIRVPSRDLDVTVRARHPEQWMATSFPYWEGMVEIEGSTGGEGYLEMTGYGDG